MLNFPFKNYEEFREMFGIIEHGNGNKSRKNKILLAYYKSASLREYALANDRELLDISDMASLRKGILEHVHYELFGKRYEVRLASQTFNSDIYETDSFNGICEDGDCKCVRYIKHTDDREQLYKMKVGRFFSTLMEESGIWRLLPEQVKRWLEEEICLEFQSYAMGLIPSNKLFVNKEFGRIYDRSQLQGDFGSCMVNKGYHTFYRDYVDASAAYLQNEEGMVIARCIVFNNVRDDRTGKIWRLAERQYSTDGNDILKLALVDALIKGGYIDGYKKVGAGCRDTNAFVDNRGNSLSDVQFSIECSADSGDIYSFQDSFAYLNVHKGRAYNYDADYDYPLDETYGYVGRGEDDDDDDDDSDYDDYHGYSCSETTEVFVHGVSYNCNVHDLDDFVFVTNEDEYHHKDDVAYCDKCSEAYVKSRSGCHSALTGLNYCCSDCCEEAELEYKKKFWHYCEFDRCYYEDVSDIKSFYMWNPALMEYVKTTIHADDLSDFLARRLMFEFAGEVYDALDPVTMTPFNLNADAYATVKEAV